MNAEELDKSVKLKIDFMMANANSMGTDLRQIEVRRGTFRSWQITLIFGCITFIAANHVNQKPLLPYAWLLPAITGLLFIILEGITCWQQENLASRIAKLTDIFYEDNYPVLIKKVRNYKGDQTLEEYLKNNKQEKPPINWKKCWKAIGRSFLLHCFFYGVFLIVWVIFKFFLD